MRIDRDAAAIVGHREEALGVEFDLDEGGVTRQRLVHRIVDDLGEQVVQRLLVGAADIHARAPPHRLQALQDLDVARGVLALGTCRAGGWLGLGLTLGGERRQRVDDALGLGFCS